MKNLVTCGFTAVLMLASGGLFAQTAPAQTPPKETAQPKPANKGSAGTITMEEYETLLKDYQAKNPGKTFQSMKKEEFETYLTTELTTLRKKRAEAKQQAPKETTEPK